MIEPKQIEDRIRGLTAEIINLEANHNKMVQENQQAQQQFQAQVAKNQSRYQQLQGAVAELQEMLKPKGTNNDNSIPPSNRSHRTVNVRTGQQPQGR